MDILTAEIGGIQWWAGTRRFSSHNHAAIAYKRMNEYGQKLRGELNVGVYRHDLEDAPGKGLAVTVVGHVREGVEEALRMLEGEPVELHPENLTRLVYRRARVLDAMLQSEAAPGAYRFPHPGGVEIDDRGNLKSRAKP